MVFLLIVCLFLEVVNQVLLPILPVHRQPKPALLRPEHHRLAVHPAHHVKRRLGLPAQGHLQDVLLDPGLDRFLQLALDLEISVRRAQTPDPLVRALVVVIANPPTDPFLRLLKAPKLRPGQELLEDRLPEPLHLPESHRMMRGRPDMLHPVLLELALEPARSPPSRILPAIVRQHLLGRAVLAHRPPVDLDHAGPSLAPEQVHSRDVPGIIVDISDQIRVLVPQLERKDIALPHLVGRGPLKEPGMTGIPLGLPDRGIHQRLLVQRPPYRLGRGLKKKNTAQYL
ncbi:MAG: hypothetical protein PHC52_12795 [Syntrophales bacterium]|nr:hypothetical protein [Syntrophales bacterium]